MIPILDLETTVPISSSENAVMFVFAEMENINQSKYKVARSIGAKGVDNIYEYLQYNINADMHAWWMDD